MTVLAEKPEFAYGQYVYEREDVETFQKRLVTHGPLTGRRVALSDGRKVGVVLSGAAWPFPFKAGGKRYEGAPVIEVKWASAAMAELAKQAELVIEDDDVFLLGTRTGDREPVEKSAGGWGRRVVAGQSIRFR